MQTPPSLRRSPVSGPCEPPHWNSCCMLPCQLLMMHPHQKAEETYKRRLPTTYRSRNSRNQRRNASSFLKSTRRQTALLPLPTSENIPKGGCLRAAMLLINRDYSSSITP